MHSGVILEFSSIAKGYFALDHCLKNAKVHIIEASAISPGKFLILLRGDIEAVGKALNAAMAVATDELIDSALLPNLDKGILDALYGLSKIEADKNGLVVVETSTLSGMLVGLHNITSQKKNVQFIEVRPGRGLGGKSTAFFTGAPAELKESLEIFLRATKSNGSFIEGQFISSPHPDFLSYFNISGGPS
jgi:microcompartment protein CcmL/EutN